MSRQPIVSAAHLVSNGAAELSEFEFGLNMAINAYHRWIVRCLAAAGQDGLGAVDGLVLHLVNHRERDKRLSDLCFLLNIEDSHVVNYSLKKLAKLDLVAADRRGKETYYGTTETGRALCQRYRDIRENCLIDSHGALGSDGQGNQEIGEAARTLRALSGLYDQAARSAASL